MGSTVIGKIENIETIARGTSVRVRRLLNETFGYGNWRKLKGAEGAKCHPEWAREVTHSLWYTSGQKEWLRRRDDVQRRVALWPKQF